MPGLRLFALQAHYGVRSRLSLKQIIIKLVQFYQTYLSPMKPPSCRYYPTCSSYMLHAVEKHGAFKGLMMGIARILRCHPFVKGGRDEVPEHFSLRRNPSHHH